MFTSAPASRCVDPDRRAAAPGRRTGPPHRAAAPGQCPAASRAAAYLSAVLQALQRGQVCCGQRRDRSPWQAASSDSFQPVALRGGEVPEVPAAPAAPATVADTAAAAAAAAAEEEEEEEEEEVEEEVTAAASSGDVAAATGAPWSGGPAARRPGGPGGSAAGPPAAFEPRTEEPKPQRHADDSSSGSSSRGELYAAIFAPLRLMLMRRLHFRKKMSSGRRNQLKVEKLLEGPSDMLDVLNEIINLIIVVILNVFTCLPDSPPLVPKAQIH
ncbi:hypothetical protein EYF80_061179 [Liparis tanakae]|uniref:Uncharacterized protein n=1 Tax=Liparis tanakae TaxID=230148 RepID=A0A4Z2EIL5_9TELE|nr:hypothetical protein EYF80_061179 [Liparis tanakae]